jgi:hypothetical protein
MQRNARGCRKMQQDAEMQKAATERRKMLQNAGLLREIMDSKKEEKEENHEKD